MANFHLRVRVIFCYSPSFSLIQQHAIANFIVFLKSPHSHFIIVFSVHYYDFICTPLPGNSYSLTSASAQIINQYFLHTVLYSTSFTSFFISGTNA